MVSRALGFCAGIDFILSFVILAGLLGRLTALYRTFAAGNVYRRRAAGEMRTDDTAQMAGRSITIDM